MEEIYTLVQVIWGILKAGISVVTSQEFLKIAPGLAIIALLTKFNRK